MGVGGVESRTVERWSRHVDHRRHRGLRNLVGPNRCAGMFSGSERAVEVQGAAVMGVETVGFEEAAALPSVGDLGVEDHGQPCRARGGGAGSERVEQRGTRPAARSQAAHQCDVSAARSTGQKPDDDTAVYRHRMRRRAVGGGLCHPSRVGEIGIDQRMGVGEPLQQGLDGTRSNVPGAAFDDNERIGHQVSLAHPDNPTRLHRSPTVR